MYVTLHTILKHPTFKDAKPLTNWDGVMKKIGRVSVFDCPVPVDIFKAKIVEPGDFFLSSLQQFHSSESFFSFVQILVQLKSSGLCVVTNDFLHLMTEEIRIYCEQFHFPMIQVDENIPYAYIMDTINRFLSIENLNAMNQLKLDKIMAANLSGKEKLDLLHSMNVNLEKFLQVFCWTGEVQSEMVDREWNIEHLNRKQDIFVNGNGTKILIISNEEREKLKHYADVTKEKLKDYFTDYHLGLSCVHACYDIDKALTEAKTAFAAAKSMDVPMQEYHPLSSMQLLISAKDSRELSEYYASYVRNIRNNMYTNNMEELLRTVETFVLCHGDYKKAGEAIHQHENTVRYRVNKVRSALGLDGDVVAFHEVISLAVKLGLLLGENKYEPM